MARLGQVAHYRAKGDRNAHVAMEDPVENRGYALWLSCQGKIRTSKAPKALGPEDRGVGDVMGYEVKVNLKRKCFDLWPGLNQMDRASQDSFISEIYAYLRASGNAICVRKPGLGEHGIPLWWMREHWNDVKAAHIFRPTELTSREKRLTPTEAGEDRDPQPVTVRQRQEAEAARQAAAEAASPAATATKTEDRRAMILELIKKSPQPLYQREIADGLGLTSLTVGRLLRELEEKGKVHRREESKGERPDDASGRYRFLYWHAKRIPIRKTPLDIGNQTMERVWAMKPGETLSTTWMSPGNQKQVKELVEQGLLEYINEGTPEERIRLAPTTPSLEQATEETVPEPTPPAQPEPEPQPEPAPETLEESADRLLAEGPSDEEIEKAVAMIDSEVAEIAGSIHRLVDQRVTERMRDLLAKMQRDTAAVEEFRQRAQRAEGLLIDARAELSEARRERDEFREKLDAIRKQLGM
jgi:predicted transcriptional regulator